MTTLLYCNIHSVNDDHIDYYLHLLPAFMHGYVRRFRYRSDQKARLLARLMLYKCLDTGGRGYLIREWKQGSAGKPFINGWNSFNISHSGDMVVFCHSDGPCGIDIEKTEDIELSAVKEAFHEEEQAFITAAADRKKVFYEIWVKKESLLKATGIGISFGLNQVCCMKESVFFYGRHWHFHKLNLGEGIAGCLCLPANAPGFIITRFDPGELISKATSG